MDSKAKTKKLDLKTGLWIFAVSWVVTFFCVYGLRQLLIPRDELDCYARVQVLQRAVDQWDQKHPDKIIREEIDEKALAAEGLLKGLSYDPEKHYYFVGDTAHGPRVKCNKDEDNPLALKLTGDTLLALLVFVVYCVKRKYVLFDQA